MTSKNDFRMLYEQETKTIDNWLTQAIANDGVVEVAAEDLFKLMLKRQLAVKQLTKDIGDFEENVKSELSKFIEDVESEAFNRGIMYQQARQREMIAEMAYGV